jgi:hypothetical protein
MTPVFTARRRAEDFNVLVEQASAEVSGTRYDDQLALVAQLRDLPQPEPTPEFTADLRERLLAAADTLLVPSDDTRRLTLPPRRTARDRGVAAAIGGLAVVGATTSLAVASQSALPGDMLYPLKRALEDAQTQLPTSDETRAETLLAHATDRLSEATLLSSTGDLSEGANVEQALVDFADQATTASDLLLADYEQTGDEQSIEGLREFTADSLQSLTELEEVLPDQARDELQYVVQVLDEIDRAAARACPACAGGINQIPSVLLSAGRVDEPSLVVVPETVLPGTSISPGGKQSQQDGTKAEGGQGDGKAGSGSGPLPDVGVGDAADPGSGGGSSGDKGLVDTLTEGLTGTGGKQNTGGTGGGTGGGGGGGGGGNLPGVPDVEDTLDDIVGGVVDDVDGVVDDILPTLP